MRSTRTYPAAPPRHPWRRGVDRQRRDLGTLTGSSVIHPARRVVPVGAGRRRCPSHASGHCLPPPLARRRSRIMGALHRADGRRGGLGRVRLDPRPDGHLDVLAREGVACRLARPRPGCDRHPMGQARIATASNDRERSAWVEEVESVLRLYLDRTARHLAR